jgi:hypothetical protein
MHASTPTLKNWRAKRAGSRITVYGEDVATRKETKITRVDKIEPGWNHCVATRYDGSTHNLLVG